MKGSFYGRDCTCKKKKCFCGAKWAFTLDIGPNPKTGKRQQKQKSGFRTKEEAVRVATELIHELNDGNYVEEQKVLFKDFAKQWLNIYRETRKVKPGTVRVRQHEIDKLMPYFANLHLKNIKPHMYQNALHSLKEEGFSESTLDGVFRTGKMIFRKAIEMRILKNDPTEFTYLPRDEQTVVDDENEIPKFLEKDKLKILLNTAQEKGLEMDYLIFLTLSYSGMRVGELVSLKWNDIDFTNHTISISKTYYNPYNNTVKYQLVPPKTKGSRRKIKVSDIVIRELLKHQEIQKKVRMHFGDSYHDQKFIFAKTERHPGFPICIKHIENRMRRLLKLAGLKEAFTPHSLRHTHTSLLAEAKVVLENIMKRLGHTDDKITRNVYRHLTEEMQTEATQKLDELMSSL